MNGTWNKTSSTIAQIQKAARALDAGLKTRERSMPIVNGHSMRSEPPMTFTLSIVQPTPMDPLIRLIGYGKPCKGTTQQK